MKRARSDYKICSNCGAALDVGERCDCEKQRIDGMLAAYRSVWEGSRLDRDSIEDALIGGTIIGIYPLYNMNPDLSVYVDGFSIAYRARTTGKVKTVDFKSGLNDREDEVSIIFNDGYVVPEEVMIAYERD